MPNDKDQHSGQTQNGGSRILKNFSLLTLPWLALQLELLEIIKKGIEPKARTSTPPRADRATEAADAGDRPKDIITPIEHLVEREVHALMMILDKSHKLRNRFGSDLENKLISEFTNIIEKVAV